MVKPLPGYDVPPTADEPEESVDHIKADGKLGWGTEVALVSKKEPAANVLHRRGGLTFKKSHRKFPVGENQPCLRAHDKLTGLSRGKAKANGSRNGKEQANCLAV